jgi:AraC-like DNA-binding protein
MNEIKRLLYLLIFTCLLSVLCPNLRASPKNEFLRSVALDPPKSVVPYWEQYTAQTTIEEVNTLFLALDDRLRTKQLKIINQLAYIKCIVELSLLDKSFSMLSGLKKDIYGQDDYIKGAYFLVYARLLFRANRLNEAKAFNRKSIQYLEKSGSLVDLKNAYLNQGFFYAHENGSKSLTYYDKARKLEEKGVKEFYVLLRTNLALKYLLENDVETALAYCDSASIYLGKPGNNNYLDEFRVLIIRASIHEQQGDLDRESRYLSQAKELAIQHKMLSNLTSITLSESYNHAEKGEYKKAFYGMIRLDSLRNELGIDQLSESIAVNDLEEKIRTERASKKQVEEHLRLKRKQQLVLLLFMTVLLISLLGIAILLQNVKRKNKVLIEQNLVLSKAETPRAKEDPEKKESHLELIIELEKLLFDKKIYEQSNLTIERLAKKLNTNRTYLSEAINAHYKTNYSSLINSVRITVARKYLASSEYDHYSIEGIAKMVGYTSISSFNTSFKKITGLTPSAFKNGRLTN